jgi:uncharacterized membrane protein
MNYAAADLHLAIAHHLLIFLLAGILAFEIGVIRLTMTGADINRVGRVDAWYGILALAIVAVGFSRAIFAAKGWGYYSINGFFWAKMAAFAAVGLLSIVPTVRIRTGLADFPHPALGQDLTPSPAARRAQARSGVRARSARKDARVDKSRPCVA